MLLRRNARLYKLRNMTHADIHGAPVALSVAGSDSGGGAGIQADLLTFAAMGVYGTTAITCLTAQNPDGVSEVFPASAAFVKGQIAQVLDYFPVTALKTGMLYDAGIIRTVCEVLKANPILKSVVDPVMVATSGATLLQEDAVRAMCDELCPLATLITPNLDEGSVMLGKRANSIDEVRTCAAELSQLTGTAVLLKGGHLEGNCLLDVLAENGEIICEYRAERRAGINSHGSGCTLSAAIAARLAQGDSLESAVSKAHDYLQTGLSHPVHLKVKPSGITRFINHERG